jgi:hypothetical protein
LIKLQFDRLLLEPTTIDHKAWKNDGVYRKSQRV